jgi:YebC/PmpR family DNA-binding regulatory protein
MITIMAGHSKWNNIKNRKGAVDAKRGKIFAQIAKLIRIAVAEGGSGDPKANPMLRIPMEKARAANMPKDNIQRAVDRGLGKSASGQAYQEVVYEGFGPAGVAFLVVAQTDNPNRTSSELKFTFSRNAGSLGSPGSAKFMFERNGESFIPAHHMEIEASDATAVQALVDALRALDDVEDVFVSVELSDDGESVE